MSIRTACWIAISSTVIFSVTTTEAALVEGETSIADRIIAKHFLTIIDSDE